MTIALEILKYTLPAIIVLIANYLILKQLIKNEQSKRNLELVMKNQQLVTPVRLQAYERFSLLLERMSPDSLIMRLNKPNMNAKQLQTELLNSIRAEFEHNVSQQIYISTQAWEVIKNARTKITQLINTSASKIKPELPAIELSKLILENLMLLDKSPVSYAMGFLKNEVKQFF